MRQSMPLYEIVTEDGMMREKFRMKEGRVYSGGSASMVSRSSRNSRNSCNGAASTRAGAPAW